MVQVLRDLYKELPGRIQAKLAQRAKSGGLANGERNLQVRLGPAAHVQ